MYVIEARNVNGVYAELLRLIRREGVRQPSRAGDVLALPAPVMLVTHRPQERVLLDPRRDANPFFHLMESLFLLAGRDDYTWLDRFVRDFSARFAEPDGHGHGSYGRRWRSHFGFDQLDVVVAKLKADPHDRRVVIQMWDASQETSLIYSGADDLRSTARDVPCNTHVYPRIVDGRLDLTVCCRSNDAVWGAAGANAVQFSMLLEYLAGRIGVQVGRLYQLANNMHAYVNRLDRYGEPEWEKWKVDPYDTYYGASYAESSKVEPVPIMSDPERWDEDLRIFMRWADSDDTHYSNHPTFTNLWFAQVAANMWLAHKYWSEKKHEMPVAVSGITAPDWRLACVNWIERRMK